MSARPGLDESRDTLAEVLDELKSRGMTAEGIECGAIKLTGLRYPLPKKADDSGTVIEGSAEDGDDLTFASAGG